LSPNGKAAIEAIVEPTGSTFYRAFKQTPVEFRKRGKA
jgi:hypothetical protein